jgi:ATP-dependent RNA helicase HelY
MTARDYLRTLPFRADEFQRTAAAAIDEGASVVVSAPTGAGKTVVAEAAVHTALEAGMRAVYTTPLKALSNQKFGDFSTAYGSDRVGLLTGDNTINPPADILVMTTEVLRNMMYAESPDLADVGVVVLDEVHYLQDRERGGVWEEIIIHLDRHIPLVCLSATVANAEEFAAWVRERRGPTEVVVERERPVRLESTYLVRDRWERGALHLHPVFHGDRPNERLVRMLRSGGGRRYTAPRRHETCDLLRRRGLLPAIYFIFSRHGCNAAVDTVVDRGLRLTTPSESEEIRAVADERTAHLGGDDLRVLGHDRWMRGLECGVAAHHAGMVPAMKETVEFLFAAGLVRLVFATETLALGINMPARTVVLESLSKFTGESHEMIRPGEYTQLTGRAGRRGIDTEGTAVILHSPYLDFERAAGIAAKGSHPLRSGFRPTYNMAVNLVARYDRATAERLLASSFAEYRETLHSRQLRDALSRDEARLAELRAVAEKAGPGVWEHADGASETPLSAVSRFTASLRPGDVIDGAAPGGGGERHVVVARGTGRHPRLVTVTENAELRRLSTTRLPPTVECVGRIDLPGPRRSRDPAYRRRVASLLLAYRPDPGNRRGVDVEPDRAGFDAEAIEAARAARRLEQRVEQQRTRLGTVPPGMVPRFRALLGLLERRGYLHGWALTTKGERLRRIYSEADLVLSEALDAGMFDDLDGPTTASLVTAFTFEPRREPGDLAWPPPVAERAASVEALWAEIAAAERSAGLPQSRPPEPGFSLTAYRWASGERLSDLFDDDSSIGDFVRNCRQAIDLLRQISDIEDVSLVGVSEALSGLDRGVVAAVGPP